MSDGTLYRAPMRWEGEFVQLRNAWLRDRELSYGARGLLAHLMSHDAGYSVTLEGLVGNSWKEGRDAVRSLVSELERRGYLVRKRLRVKGKLRGYEWHLVDPFDRELGGAPLVDNRPASTSAQPTSVEPTSARPSTVHPTYKKTELRTENSFPSASTGRGPRAVDNSRHGRCGHDLVDERHCALGCSPAVVIGLEVLA